MKITPGSPCPRGELKMPDFKNIRAILFDIDGTLFSSEGIIGQVYQSAFAKFFEHFPEKRELASVPDLPAILNEIGKPVVEIFRNLAPNLSEADRSTVSGLVLEDLVERIGKGEGEHYPEVPETLAELHRRGFVFFAASNGRLAYIEAILAANGTRPWFAEVPAIDNVDIKNKNVLVRRLVERHGLDAANAVLIGDRASDRDAALAAGLPFIACRYGHATDAAEQEGAAAYIDRVADLLELLPSKAVIP